MPRRIQEPRARRQELPTLLLAFALALIPSVSLCGTLLDFGRSVPESVTIVEWLVGPAALAALLLWAWWHCPQTAPDASVTSRDATVCGQWHQAQVRRRILMSTFGFFLLLAASRSVSENVVRERIAGPAPAGEGWRDLYDAACWLKYNAAPGEAVASDRISLVWFWAGLQGVPIPRTRDQAQAQRQLGPAQWLIVDGLEEDQVAARYLRPLLARDPGAWQPRLQRNQTWVLRRRQTE